MKKIPFKEYHLLEVLKNYSAKSLPMDCIIADYFKIHKALGSKDRAFIADTAYGMIRWKGLLDYITQRPDHWESTLDCYLSINIADYLQNETIPLCTRYSFPPILFDALTNAYGIDKTLKICLNSNGRAPATIRVNTLKTTRDDLLKKWNETLDVRPCSMSPSGIVFNKKINFFSLPEFKQGLFEVQDEGSQLLSDLVEAQPGDLILDYCAGAGGKTLAIAPKMKQKGQIYLHDIRKKALLEARQRLKRAGVQNAQIIFPDSPQLKKLKKKFDWILVDAPCSGTGTLRRNPDMKWRFNEQTLPKLTGLQRTIFEKALSYLKTNGYIIYATCSILKEENQNQMEFFCQTYGLTLVKEPFQTFPSPDEMDGFFAAVFRKS